MRYARFVNAVVGRGPAAVTAFVALVVIAVSAPAQSPPVHSAPRRVAAADAGGPAWQALTPQQRTALAPLQSEWHTIDASRKAKWLEIASRFHRLPPAEQQRLQGRMTEWSRLSPGERGQARLNFQEMKQLPPQERQAQWEAYQALPEDQRKALATRARPQASASPPAARVNGSGSASAKRNIVVNPSLTAAPAKPVAPTVVQAAPGATTTLVTRQPSPPPYQQAGLPKIAATPGFVDRATLLPKRGPQGAATRAAGASQPRSP